MADHHGPINVHLSFPHPLLVRSGHVDSSTSIECMYNIKNVLSCLRQMVIIMVMKKENELLIR